MTIGKKIIGGYLLVLAMMLVAVVTGLYSIMTLHRSFDEFMEVHSLLIQYAGELRYEVDNQTASFRGMLLYAVDEKKFSDAMDASHRRFESVVDSMRSLLNSDKQVRQKTQEMLVLLESMKSLHVKYRQVQERAATLATSEWNLTDALWADHNEVRPLATELLETVQRFGDLQSKFAEREKENIQLASSRISFLMSTVSLLALILGLAIGVLTTRSITRQLQEHDMARDRAEEQVRAASLYARKIIEANLDPLVTIDPQGRITDVNKAAEQVTGVARPSLVGSDFTGYFTEPEKAREACRQVLSQGVIKDFPLVVRHTSGKVADVLYNISLLENDAGETQGVLAVARDITERRQMEENLRRQNQALIEAREAVDAAGILAASVNAILASTSQLATAAQETAAAVNEAATSIVEIRQTAQLTSEKAGHVSEDSQRMTVVAKQGKKVVDQTIAGINRIKQQTEIVAETILTLSEQSLAIGEIIASVNDLAEQSNLLAINAAIEAAKAGEQGRGFAVVAQEVKSLADQSKQATAQVRTILNDIQKATSAAVLATEQGSKAVAAGVTQSIETGEAIGKLENSIVESSHAAIQIAAASNQQLVGLDQIASAMENIKETITQNMEDIRHMDQAVRGLCDLGERLNMMVKTAKA